jgi:hypothetical protein
LGFLTSQAVIVNACEGNAVGSVEIAKKYIEVYGKSISEESFETKQGNIDGYKVKAEMLDARLNETDGLYRPEKVDMLKWLLHGSVGPEKRNAIDIILKSAQDRDELEAICSDAGGTKKIYEALYGSWFGLKSMIDSDYGPSMTDQYNPNYPTISKGKEDYRIYFDLRFPNTMREAEETIKSNIEREIGKLGASGKNTDEIPWNYGEDTKDKYNFPVNDDLNTCGHKYGDEKQGPLERTTTIGAFWVKAKDIKIHWKNNGGFTYEATMYVEEQTGVKSGEPLAIFEPICGKRYVNMGEWRINGKGSC